MGVVSVSMPDELLTSVTERVGKRDRSRFIFEAVEAALGINNSVAGDGEPPPKREAPMRPATKPPSVDGLRADDRVVLRHLQGRRGSSERLIGQDLEWPAMRVSKAVNRLANVGMVVFPSPGYVRIAEDG